MGRVGLVGGWVQWGRRRRGLADVALDADGRGVPDGVEGEEDGVARLLGRKDVVLSGGTGRVSVCGESRGQGGRARGSDSRW